MALTMNDKARNTALDALADLWDGAAGKLEIRTGAAPGATNAATGTILATITLPAPAFAASAAGVVAKTGTWEDTSADNPGTALHYRIETNDGLTILEGSVGVGSGDLQVDNDVFAAGQAFTITSFTWTLGA